MNFTEQLLTKKVKVISILIMIAGLCSLLIFIPYIRELIIVFGEKYSGKSLNHETWHERLVALEIVFLIILLCYSLFIYFRRQLVEYKLPFYDYLDLKIKNTSTDQWLHYISLFFYIIVLCIIHFCFAESGDDTGYFNHVLQNTSYLEFLKDRYSNWSSRLLIETVLVNCYGFSFGFWRVFDTLAFVLIAECMIAICIPEKKFSFIVYATILLFTDYSSLQSAGWGATTVNYLWPLACSMPFFVVTKNIFLENNSTKLRLIISILLLMFAINQEQMAVLIFGLDASFLVIRLVKNKHFQKLDWYFFIVLILSLSSIVFIAFCPGNSKRFSTEIQTWFPEYSSLSLFEKIQLGILTIFTYYFTNFRGVWGLIPFCFILSIKFYKTNKKNFIIQLVLNFYIILSMVLDIVFKLVGKNFLLSNNQLSQFTEFSKIAVFCECIILLFGGIVFCYQVVSAMKNRFQGLFNAFLLCAAFCSAFILAFSPTVYASGPRCYLFMSYMIFFISFRIFYDSKQVSYDDR